MTEHSEVRQPATSEPPRVEDLARAAEAARDLLDPTVTAAAWDHPEPRPRPVLLLDVDGVLWTQRPWREPRPRSWPTWEWEEFEVDTEDRGSRFLWSPLPVLRFLCFLDPMVGWRPVEIRWHSTWYDRCARFLAPALQLPDWPVALCLEFFWLYGDWADTMPPEYLHPGALPRHPARLPMDWWWKLPAADRIVLDEHRPLIWIDDEIHQRAETNDDLRRLITRPDVLAISPNGWLRPEDLQRIADWLHLDEAWNSHVTEDSEDA
jgi:hypothetical protein